VMMVVVVVWWWMVPPFSEEMSNCSVFLSEALLRHVS
jgi:hypothetical protein